MRAFLHHLASLLRPWGWSFLICGLVALLFAGQIVWTVSMPAGEAWHMAARDWLPWAVLCPLLFRLVSRLPLERARWRLALPIHLACSLMVLAMLTWWGEVVVPPPSRALNTEADRQTAPPPADHRHWLFPILFFRIPVYLAVVSVAHAVYFYRRSLARDHSLSEARLAALRMQLQPHFLFNSLNAIAELVHHDPDGADEMLAALGGLLRLSLETSGEQLLPLYRELEFVERYLAIEHVRFGDRLSFTLDVVPEVRAALVPAFLLQPLVENAVRHGLEPRAGKGLLKVSARRTGESLWLGVSDNGAGLPEGKLLREGIGLSNTRARLQVLFDGAANLELEHVDGLTVHVTMPFQTAVSAARV